MKVTFKSGQTAVYALQDTNGGVLHKLEGFVTGTANTQYFIHVFDNALATPPVNGNIPKRSLQVIGQDGYSFNFSADDLEFKNSIYLALSSTEETYTAVLDGAKSDFEGEIDTQAIQGTTTVGDLVTLVTSLSVWTTAQGPRYLFEVDWAPGQLSFLLFFTKDAPVNGDTADAIVARVGASFPAIVPVRFGKSGLSLISQSGTKGCKLCVSTTAPTLTLIGATDLIRAKYKTSL